MHHLLDPNRRVLEEWFSERGEPGYRVRQVEKWLFNEGRVHEPQEMTDLPARLRDQLAQSCTALAAEMLLAPVAYQSTFRESGNYRAVGIKFFL